MSTNDTLRGLLSEAKELLGLPLGKQTDEFMARIDAALAEPVSGGVPDERAAQVTEEAICTLQDLGRFLSDTAHKRRMRQVGNNRNLNDPYLPATIGTVSKSAAFHLKQLEPVIQSMIGAALSARAGEVKP